MGGAQAGGGFGRRRVSHVEILTPRVLLSSVPSSGEFGWGGVAGTWLAIDPRHELACVFMTQLIPSTAIALIRPQLRWLAHWMALDHAALL